MGTNYKKAEHKVSAIAMEKKKKTERNSNDREKRGKGKKQQRSSKARCLPEKKKDNGTLRHPPQRRRDP